MMRHFWPAIALLFVTGCLKPYWDFDYGAASRIRVGKPIVQTSANGDFSVQVEVTNVSSTNLCILLGEGKAWWATSVIRASDEARMKLPDLELVEDEVKPLLTRSRLIAPRQSRVFETHSNIFLHKNVRNRDGSPGQVRDLRSETFYVIAEPSFTPCDPAYDGQIYDIRSRERPVGSVDTPPSDPFGFR